MQKLWLDFFWIGIPFLLMGGWPLICHAQEEVVVHPLVDSMADAGEKFPCFLIMDQTDQYVSVPEHLTKAEKATLVYYNLAHQATTSQQEILDSLHAWGIPTRPFYIVNAIQVVLDGSILSKLRTRQDISSILPDFPLVTLPVEIPQGDRRRLDIHLNWAIGHLSVDSVWQMGITGKNVVVAGLDTGVEWDHSFLMKSYRGFSSESSVAHDYNWHDAVREVHRLHEDSSGANPCGLQSPIPCDDHGHGTFTMGLMTGLHDGQYTGMAPGAEWIGSRVMERGYGLLSTYLSGLEWCLAPTDIEGNKPRPDLAPDIINNSWECPSLEGCIPDNFWLLDSAVNRLHRSGILVVASAGNSGRSGCGSLQNPLAIFSNVLTIGATDRHDSIAAFSSRGTTFQDRPIKPDLVAPGQEVVSIYPNDQFPTRNGTSISSPIAAAVAALVLEANPQLRGKPGLIREILIQSAIPIPQNPCTENQIPNPVFGHGRIDALRAVRMAQEYMPTSVPSPKEDLSVDIFPNPANDVFRIVNKNDQKIEVSVYDIQGKSVIKSIGLPPHHEDKIMVSQLHPGIYLVHIRNQTAFTMQKIMKL